MVLIGRRKVFTLVGSQILLAPGTSEPCALRCNGRIVSLRAQKRADAGGAVRRGVQRDASCAAFRDKGCIPPGFRILPADLEHG